MNEYTQRKVRCEVDHDKIHSAGLSLLLALPPHVRESLYYMQLNFKG